MILAKMEVDVATNMGIKTSIQEFFNIGTRYRTVGHGVQLHSSLVDKIVEIPVEILQD